MNTSVKLLELKPCRTVQSLALWAVQNVRLGASGPYILRLALRGEPMPAGILPMQERGEENKQWRWWLDHACDRTTFLGALREREGVELKFTDLDAANDA